MLVKTFLGFTYRSSDSVDMYEAQIFSFLSSDLLTDKGVADQGPRFTNLYVEQLCLWSRESHALFIDF